MCKRRNIITYAWPNIDHNAHEQGGAGLVGRSREIGRVPAENLEMNHGETPARRALRENSVAASEAVQRSLPLILQYLKQEKFITGNQLDGILTTSGVSASYKAGQALGAVEAKVDSGNDPVKGGEWLETFLKILRRQDIGEEAVAKEIAKLYGESYSRWI